METKSLVQKLKMQAEREVAELLMVDNAGLPERYHGKRGYRKLSSVVKQLGRRRKSVKRDGREVSVKFNSDRQITAARPERLAILESYAAAVADGREIDYQVNESRLYSRQVAFCKLGAAQGWIRFDDEDDE